ncbi:MAG: HEPN domain-containing protein [Deltaproteobacteria bacterium]|nr:HEPN domain-containing protein [Deltaproteobacteria bacterium]MBW2074800.1 HEPN domain-containing protein [Deltaproteobacteria bacterium]RLB80310.1 MAG: hypothetical protein DRH17_12285 [Deltaproteobacteria bacterium]
MDGRLFLCTARFLQNNGVDEAAYRSAISRAYYACFIAVRDLVFRVCSPEYRRKAGIKDERGIGHKPLREYYLKNGTTESVKRLRDDLKSLYTSRIDADYNMRQTITKDDAQYAIEEAELVLQSLSMVSEKEIETAVNNYFQAIYPDQEQEQ